MENSNNNSKNIDKNIISVGKPMLELNNIEVIYDFVSLAIKGVSLSVPEGSMVALLGGNGGPSSRQRLRVGYAYDLVVSNIRTTSYGTHELQVNYCFTFELPARPPKIYRHPRWMNRSPKTD